MSLGQIETYRNTITDMITGTDVLIKVCQWLVCSPSQWYIATWGTLSRFLLGSLEQISEKNSEEAPPGEIYEVLYALF